MTDLISERIVRAVEQGVAARAAYYQAIELPDEQVLGPPAMQAQLDRLELALDKALPPSYRAFLTLFDGWKMIDGGLDLLSVDDLLGGARHQHVSEWQRKMAKYGDEVAARSLVIGVSSITPTKYLLDPHVVDEQGEWRLVQHHDGEEAEVSSFLRWLEDSVEEYRELAGSARSDASD